jgi:hypothetical protein
MQEETKVQLTNIAKRLDRMAQEQLSKKPYDLNLGKLRLLAELVREQTDSYEILIPSKTKACNSSEV